MSLNLWNGALDKRTDAAVVDKRQEWRWLERCIRTPSISFWMILSLLSTRTLPSTSSINVSMDLSLLAVQL